MARGIDLALLHEQVQYNPYSGLPPWSGYQAVKHIFHGPDWKKNVITPQHRIP